MLELFILNKEIVGFKTDIFVRCIVNASQVRYLQNYLQTSYDHCCVGGPYWDSYQDFLS